MKTFNSLQDSSIEKNDTNKVNQKKDESSNELEKILCHHCGRTLSNGIRCLGICVADNDY